MLTKEEAIEAFKKLVNECETEFEFEEITAKIEEGKELLEEIRVVNETYNKLKENSKLKLIVEKINELIKSYYFLVDIRATPAAFSRPGEAKLQYYQWILFMLYLNKKTISTEILSFYRELNNNDTIQISGQAFTQAREKIKPIAFELINDVILENAMEPAKTFNGYNLLSIDGSVFELQYEKELIEHYGCMENQSVEIPATKVELMFDPLNGLTIGAIPGKYKTDERTLLKDLINKLNFKFFLNSILLLDRGYPSLELIEYFQNKNIKYVMRVSKSFIKESNEFFKTDELDKTVHLIYNKVTNTVYRNKVAPTNKDEVLLTIRMVKVILDTGAIEVLLTNLTKEEMPTELFKELYGKRWPVEGEFGFYKNVLEIENFTGTSVLAVEQDLNIAICISNMLSVAITEANEIIKTEADEIDEQLNIDNKVKKNWIIRQIEMLHYTI